MIFKGPVLLNSLIFNLNPSLPGPTNNPMNSFLGLSHICNGAVSSCSHMHFTSISLLSGSCHGEEDKEALSEQGISSVQGGSQIRTVKASLSPQKAKPCETCGLILSGIFHLAEYQGTCHKQKLCMYGAHEKSPYFRTNHQNQKQHTGEKPLRSDVKRVLFVKSCKLCVSRKPFSFGEDGKDFLGKSGFLHQQTTHTREKSNNGTERRDTFPRKKNDYSRIGCTETFSHKHTLIQYQRVFTRVKYYMCSECGKSFGKSSHLIRHRSVHTGERSYECSECGKSFSKSYSLNHHQSVHTGKRPYERS